MTEALSSPSFDCIVIGGGVNGTGVARDLSIRGLKVALVERNDLGFGASGNSSGMIHGGPRYLTQSPGVTYSSCLDSGHIQRIAPHLLFRVPFLVPVYGSGPGAFAQLLVYDAFFEAYDRYQSLKRSKTHLKFGAEQVRALEPGLVPVAGAVSFDEWGVDGVRLCVQNALDAVERGARYFHRTSVVELLRGGHGEATGVRVVDHRSGETRTLFARIVVNATGAWSNGTTDALGVARREPLVRPGKGIHVYLDRRLSNFAIITKAVDGREVFLLPWQNMSVLGTTDTDYYGDPDRVVATEDEVEYLFQAVARVFPSVTKARPIGTWGGLRPTMHEWGKAPDRLSREHAIVDHGAEGVDGLYSMIGGKLASYRLFAEEMSDVIATRTGHRAKCQTAVLSLPGGEEAVSEHALVEEFGVDLLTARRLAFRHGSRALRVLEPCRAEGASAAVVCPCEPVTEAEVRYVVREEWAVSVADVARRTRLGHGACGGLLCAKRAGELLAEELGASEDYGRASAREFLTEAAERRLAIRSPLQTPTEERLRAQLRAELDWEPPERPRAAR